MDLMEMEMDRRRRELTMTVLRRPGGVWHAIEVAKLRDGLKTGVSGHPNYPEYLVLYLHYSKEETLNAIGGGVAYTATQVTGLQDERLPFNPGFI